MTETQQPSEFTMPEPVFRSSEGQDAHFKKEVPVVSENNGTPENHTDLLTQTLERIKTAKTEEEIRQMLADYNAQASTPFDPKATTITEKVGEIDVEGKRFSVIQANYGNRALTIQEVDIAKSEKAKEPIWPKIENDPKLRGILSIMVLDNFDQFNSTAIVQAGEHATPDDLQTFYKKFPKEHDYMSSDKVSKMLDGIKAEFPGDDGPYREYFAKAITFVDLMFPEV